MTDAQVEEYLLGSSEGEIQRLRTQDEVWGAQTDALLARSGIARGGRVLDLGCGPGFTSLRLARHVGGGGEVVGVDRSSTFSRVFAELMAASGVSDAVRFHRSEVDDLGGLASTQKFDAAYARWLFCFLPDPGRVIDSARACLRPGGRLIIQDYRSYLDMGFRPRHPDLARAFDAVHNQFAAHGGNLDIGDELPGLLETRGFRCESLIPIQALARPDEPHWRWFEGFKANHFPGLVKEGFLSEAELAAFDRALVELRTQPGAYFVLPPMIAIVAIADG